MSLLIRILPAGSHSQQRYPQYFISSCCYLKCESCQQGSVQLAAALARHTDLLWHIWLISNGDESLSFSGSHLHVTIGNYGGISICSRISRLLPIFAYSIASFGLLTTLCCFCLVSIAQVPSGPDTEQTPPVQGKGRQHDKPLQSRHQTSVDRKEGQQGLLQSVQMPAEPMHAAPLDLDAAPSSLFCRWCGRGLCLGHEPLFPCPCSSLQTLSLPLQVLCPVMPINGITLRDCASEDLC